jgi:hypothetical protein
MQMGNRTLVTRKFGRVLVKNHQGSKNLISKFFVAQRLSDTYPIRAADTNRITRIILSPYSQNAMRLKALQRVDFPARIL